MIAYGEEKTFARTVAAGTTIFDSAVSQLRGGRSDDAVRDRRRSSCTTPTGSRST